MRVGRGGRLGGGCPQWPFRRFVHTPLCQPESSLPLLVATLVAVLLVLPAMHACAYSYHMCARPALARRRTLHIVTCDGVRCARAEGTVVFSLPCAGSMSTCEDRCRSHEGEAEEGQRMAGDRRREDGVLSVVASVTPLISTRFWTDSCS
jgi:hypothetical protein